MARFAFISSSIAAKEPFSSSPEPLSASMETGFWFCVFSCAAADVWKAIPRRPRTNKILAKASHTTHSTRSQSSSCFKTRQTLLAEPRPAFGRAQQLMGCTNVGRFRSSGRFASTQTSAPHKLPNPIPASKSLNSRRRADLSPIT